MKRKIQEELLITALEGGSNYWYMLNRDEFKDYPGPAGSEKVWQAIQDNKTISVFDAEDPDDKIGEINKESITHGCILMESNHPGHYFDAIAERGDAETADVWFQLCCMGEIVFG